MTKLIKYIIELIDRVFPFLRQSRFIKKVEAIGLIFLLQVVITILIGALSIHFFLELAEEVVEKNPTLLRVDEFILDEFNSEYFPAFLKLAKVVTTLGSWAFITLTAFLLSLYFLMKTEKRIFIFHVAIVAFGTMGFNRLLKSIFDRERPDGPHLVEVISTSYPSGHAMLSFAFYGLMIYFTWISTLSREWKISLTVSLVLLISLVGLSRVYLGVHYPSDVVAGYAAGAFWLSLSLVTGRAAERIFRNNHSDQANSRNH